MKLTRRMFGRLAAVAPVTAAIPAEATSQPLVVELRKGYQTWAATSGTEQLATLISAEINAEIDRIEAAD